MCQFIGRLCLAGFGIVNGLARRAIRDIDIERGQNSLVPPLVGADDSSASCRGLVPPVAGSLGWGKSGVTSSMRHTRSGIDFNTASSSVRSWAAKSPRERHSPGCRGGRHSRSRWPCAASWRERRLLIRSLNRLFGRPGRDVGGHSHEVFHRGGLLVQRAPEFLSHPSGSVLDGPWRQCEALVAYQLQRGPSVARTGLARPARLGGESPGPAACDREEGRERPRHTRRNGERKTTLLRRPGGDASSRPPARR